MPQTGSDFRIPSALLAGFLLAAGVACDRTATEGKVEPNITITKADQGKTLHLARGGSLTVRLAWSPGTGYDWVPGALDGTRLQMEGEPGSEPNKEPMPGAPEIRIFRFRALKPGTTSLEFHSRRPWEKEAAPAETFRIQLTIQ